jgi:chromosome partitioning protein
MAKTYAVANQKGGVGKTTTVINVCAYLAAGGRRVLLVDMDPQANATSALGYNKYEIECSTYDLLLDSVAAADAVINHSEVGIDLIPSHPSLAGAEIELVSAEGREFRLLNALQPLTGQYDYILIDCPPSLGLLTLNALTAARDGVLIPVQCEYLALEGLTQLLQTIDLVRDYLNPHMRIRGVMLTMYDSRTNLGRQVVDEVRRHFPNKVFRTIIPRNVRLGEAPSFGQPINVYAPHSSGAVAYQLLTAELVSGDRRDGVTHE